MYKTIPVLLFVALFLAACANPQSAPEPAQTATAVIAEVVVTNTAVSPTPTQTQLPTVLQTKTSTPTHVFPVATNQARWEDTPTKTATPTPTSTPTSTPTPIPPPTASFWQGDLAPAHDDFQVVDQLGGRISFVTAKDGVAYVGVGPRLFLLDMSQPDAPVELSESDILPSVIKHIAVVNNTAYVLTGDESGFWIVDVSQPSRPQIVSFFATAVPINFIREWNGRLYVDPSAEGEDALIFSVDNPLQPTLVGELPDKYYPVANDQYVYTTHTSEDNQFTIIVADASDLTNIHPVSETATTFNGHLIAIDDAYYYFLNAEGQPTLWMMEKQNPDNTPIKLNIYVSPYVYSFKVENQIIYLMENFGDAGSYGSSIYAFDVSKTNVRELEWLRTGNRSYNTFIDENIIYVATGETLVIAEINEERNMDMLSEWQSSGDLDWIDAEGNQLFSLNIWDNHVFQHEVDELQTLQLLHDHQSLQIDEVVLMEDTVFTTGWFKGIHRFQSDTIPWQETAVFNRPNGIEFVDQMFVQGDTLYARLDGDLGIFDISDPSEIKQIGQLDWETYHIEEYTVNQDTLYTWTEQGLKAMSITDPAAPQEIGLLPYESDSRLYDLAANDTHIYLLTGSCLDTNCNNIEVILQVVDISDPTNMTLVAQLPWMGGPKNIKVSGNKLLLTGGDFWLVDITDPTQPQINGRFSTPGHAQDAVIVNDLIYIADDAGGLLVLKFEE